MAMERGIQLDSANAIARHGETVLINMPTEDAAIELYDLLREGVGWELTLFTVDSKAPHIGIDNDDLVALYHAMNTEVFEAAVEAEVARRTQLSPEITKRLEALGILVGPRS